VLGLALGRIPTNVPLPVPKSPLHLRGVAFVLRG
jgi:hypothetical protein